jgi:amino acid transporter
MLGQLALFVVLAGVTIFVAWLAGTGRVMYVLVMLWIAAAFGFAVLDLVDYEIVKRERRN